MSIDLVDKLLRDLLRTSVSGRLDDESIAVISPDAVKDRDGIHLGLFLYASIESPMLKNEPMRPAVNGTRKRPPMMLDLYYLLTAYGNPNAPGEASGREIDAHRLLRLSMSALHRNGVLVGTQLPPELRTPEYGLRVSLNPITIEDMTRIWSVFVNTSYRASVCYVVTPVPIEAGTVDVGPPVYERTDRLGMIPTVPAGAAS